MRWNWRNGSRLPGCLILSGSVAADAIVSYRGLFGWDGGFMVMAATFLAIILLIVVEVGEKRRHEQLKTQLA